MEKLGEVFKLFKTKKSPGTDGSKKLAAGFP